MSVHISELPPGIQTAIRRARQASAQVPLYAYATYYRLCIEYDPPAFGNPHYRVEPDGRVIRVPSRTSLEHFGSIEEEVLL